MTPVLELEGVGLTYPGEPPVHALRDVDLRIAPGELVAVVGPSGSGKSTLLHVMGTLDRPTEGRMRLTGVDVASLGDEEVAALRARSIGFVFQQFFLDERITALENVANGLLYAGVPAEERLRRAAAALEAVGLADRVRFLPMHMSGGQRQRVAIARALVGAPSLVLADEPTGNLDSAAGAEILALLQELNRRGTTVVVITHDRDLAAQMPRRVEVRDGRIVADSGSVAASGAVTPPARLAPTRLGLRDLVRLAAAGLRTRRQRAALSALGIAIGVAATVAVLGLSASAQAGLLAEIDRLGTNLLTVANGTNFLGQAGEMPLAAPGMIGRLGGVHEVAETGQVSANAYRNPLVPSGQTGGLNVRAASTNLLPVVGTAIAEGAYLNPATATEPVAVLGAQAAIQLGIDRITAGERIWVGGQWFYVAGILQPAPLAPEIDTSVLVGFPAAAWYLDFDSHPSTVYVRAANNQVAAVDALLGYQADPEDPSQVSVSQPSKALVARAQAKGAFTGLFVALAAVALLVGGIGVANIMVISVLERRGEIGLRRALGATRAQIRVQFLAEAMLLAGLGGLAGIAAGVLATAIYALTQGWSIVVPPLAWAGGLTAALAIGAVSGLVPAQRAAALSPTEALRTV
jgi:putative ABC transport system permease protein